MQPICISKKIICQSRMPTNKHASFRYRALDQCFTNRGRRKWTLDELVQEVSRFLQEEFGADTTVSQRTIQGDINVMRSARPRGFGAPIVCRQGLYFYGNPQFRIEKMPLGQEEVDLLRDAVAVLRQLPGMPQLPAVQILLQRVSGRSGAEALSPGFIQFETNPAVRGLEWLAPLYQAIAQRQAVRIDYHPFTEAPLHILLHPYLLKEWHNRWYVFGRNTDDKLWNLALDRMQGVAVAEEVAYQENDLFDPETWFNDLVGVTKPEGAQPVEVLLETTYLPSRYLETRPIHPSQRLLRQEGERYVFALRVIVNPELVNELVRFGNDVKVAAPVALKEMVERRLG